MSKADFAIAIWVILLVAFVGVKEIVWRKMEVTDMSPDAPWGKKVMERWHGNRPLGVLLILLALYLLGVLALKVGWIHLPGVLPN